MSHHAEVPRDRRAFNCSHCGGQILIPINLPPTSGPCPHCSKLITSPSARDDSNLPDRKSSNPPRKLTSKAEPTRKLRADQPAAAPPADKDLIKLDSSQLADQQTPRKTAAERKSSPSKPVISSKPRAFTAKSEVMSDFHQLLEDEGNSHLRSVRTTIALTILAISAVGGFYFYNKNQKDPAASSANAGDTAAQRVMTREFIEGGWEKEARHVLRSYLAATTSIGKTAYILGGKDSLPRLVRFYQGSIINDLDTPEETFVANPLSAADHERGLFRMSYAAESSSATAPPSLPTTPDLAGSRHLLHPREAADTPTHIDAFFLHTPDGLKLDWDLFAQTKYRTLIRFANHPTPGQRMVFRVQITPIEPAPGLANPHFLHYRIADPANPKDVVLAVCRPNSEVARSLSKMHQPATAGDGQLPRNATLELTWQGNTANPDLIISSFLCWEFHGLDGK